MQALADKISGIEQKVKSLAQKLEQLQKENAALKELNNSLKTDLAIIKEKGDQVLTQPEVVKTPVAVSKNGDGKNSKKLRKELEQYIKEIDKCIEWLQND